jgi:hypothetical protein
MEVRSERVAKHGESKAHRFPLVLKYRYLLFVAGRSSLQALARCDLRSELSRDVASITYYSLATHLIPTLLLRWSAEIGRAKGIVR